MGGEPRVRCRAQPVALFPHRFERRRTAAARAAQASQLQKDAYEGPDRSGPRNVQTNGGGTLRCARAVRKVGYLGPVFPDAEGDCGHYCVPRRRTTQILTQSQNSDNESKQTIFPTENAGLLSESAVFAPWRYASLVVGGLQGDLTS